MTDLNQIDLKVTTAKALDKSWIAVTCEDADALVRLARAVQPIRSQLKSCLGSAKGGFNYALAMMVPDMQELDEAIAVLDDAPEVSP